MPWCRIFKISDIKVSGTTKRKSFKYNHLYKVSESFTVKYGLNFVVSGSAHAFWICNTTDCNISSFCVSVIICGRGSSLIWHDVLQKWENNSSRRFWSRMCCQPTVTCWGCLQRIVHFQGYSWVESCSVVIVTGNVVFVVAICSMLSEKLKLVASDHSQQQNKDLKHIHGTFHTKILLIMSLFRFGYSFVQLQSAT